MECLPEHVYTARIQHKIHTTRLYNTPIQRTNRRIKRKRKMDLIEVIKGGTYIQIRLGFSLYSLTKRTSERKREKKNILSH